MHIIHQASQGINLVLPDGNLSCNLEGIFLTISISILFLVVLRHGKQNAKFVVLLLLICWEIFEGELTATIRKAMRLNRL